MASGQPWLLSTSAAGPDLGPEGPVLSGAFSAGLSQALLLGLSLWAL